MCIVSHMQYKTVRSFQCILCTIPIAFWTYRESLCNHFKSLPVTYAKDRILWRFSSPCCCRVILVNYVFVSHLRGGYMRGEEGKNFTQPYIFSLWTLFVWGFKQTTLPLSAYQSLSSHNQENNLRPSVCKSSPGFSSACCCGFWLAVHPFL